MRWKVNSVSYVIGLSQAQLVGKFFFRCSDQLDAVLSEGYFLVDPELTVGPMSKVLPLDSIKIHTVLPKLLGPFDEWKDRLMVSHKCAYNMIHFTPLQKLNSCSNSSYSISNQLQLNPNFSTTGTAPIALVVIYD